jgi:hypothetical protein
MSKTGDGGYEFVLASSPQLAPVKGNNEWEVTVATPEGDAAAGTALGVKPFMPDHNHGSGIAPVVDETDDGAFHVEKINLWMPGLWEVTLSAKDGDATLDDAVFRFCIDG